MRSRGSAHWLRAAMAVLAVVAGTVVTTAQPAHAVDRVVLDTFDDYPYTRWRRETPAKTVVEFGEHRAALRGVNLGLMQILPNTPVQPAQAPQAHTYRTVNVPRPGGPGFCMLELYLSQWSGAQGYFDITVHEGGITGPVLATEAYLTWTKRWTQWKMTRTFAWRPELTLSLKMRLGYSHHENIAATGSLVLVDDVMIRCVGLPA